VHGTSQAHLLKPFFERLPTSMNPNCHVIQRSAEACRDAVSRLAKDVGAPDDVRIIRFERWQQLVETVADCAIEFDIRLDRKALDIGLFQATSRWRLRMAWRWWSTIVLARIRPSHPRTVRTSRKSAARSRARSEKRCNTSWASSRPLKRRRRKASRSWRDSTRARRTAASVALATADPFRLSSRDIAWPAFLHAI